MIAALGRRGLNLRVQLRRMGNRCGSRLRLCDLGLGRGWHRDVSQFTRIVPAALPKMFLIC